MQRLIVAALAVVAFAAGAADEPPPPTPRDHARAAAPLVRATWFGAAAELRLGYELTVGERRNLDLDDTRDRDRHILDQEAKAELRLDWSPRLSGAVELSLLSEVRRRPGEVQRKEGLQRGPMWLRWRWSESLALQAGRVPLVEPRTWWWDDDLDGVRLQWQRGDLSVESGLARELLREHTADRGIDPERRGITRWFGQAGWQAAKRHRIDLFWLRAVDGSGSPAEPVPAGEEDTRDANLSWLGLRASGQWRGEAGEAAHRLGYWLDTAWMRGNETVTVYDDLDDGTLVPAASTPHRVHGHAVDLGLQWQGPWSWRPVLTAAWARGSRDFRQTGLQENKARLGGAKRFQRYGEAFDPELGNLSVATLGAGVRPWQRTSFELAWHRYKLVEAAMPPADTRVTGDVDGRHRELGEAVEVLFAWREWAHGEVTLSAARFRPGAAYVVRDPAIVLELGMAMAF